MLASTKRRSVHGQAKGMHQYVSHLWIRQRIVTVREKAIHCCTMNAAVGLFCIFGLVRDFTRQFIPFLPAIKPKSILRPRYCMLVLLIASTIASTRASVFGPGGASPCCIKTRQTADDSSCASSFPWSLTGDVDVSCLAGEPEEPAPLFPRLEGESVLR